MAKAKLFRTLDLKYQLQRGSYRISKYPLAGMSLRMPAAVYVLFFFLLIFIFLFKALLPNFRKRNCRPRQPARKNRKKCRKIKGIWWRKRRFFFLSFSYSLSPSFLSFFFSLFLFLFESLLLLLCISQMCRTAVVSLTPRWKCISRMQQRPRSISRAKYLCRGLNYERRSIPSATEAQQMCVSWRYTLSGCICSWWCICISSARISATKMSKVRGLMTDRVSLGDRRMFVVCMYLPDTLANM